MELIGKNSVTPSTSPSTAALRGVNSSIVVAAAPATAARTPSGSNTMIATDAATSVSLRRLDIQATLPVTVLGLEHP